MFRILIQVIVLLLLVSVLGSGSAADAPPPDTDAIVAKVGTTTIRNSEVEGMIDSYIPPGGFHGGVSSDKRREYRSQAIDILIEKELFYLAARERGYKATEEEINNLIEANIKRFPSKKAFEKEVSARGLTEERFRELVAREIVIGKFVSDEITGKSRYTDEELRDYYEKNIDKFKRPESMRVWHILVGVSPNSTEEEKAKRKERAEEAYAKVKKGDDFILLAEQYSDDAYRVKGGDLGYIHKGRLDPDLEVAAFRLKEGEISPIVETIYGFHIIKAGDRKPAETVPFDEAKGSLRSDLEKKRFNETKKNVVSSLKERTGVEIF